MTLATVTAACMIRGTYNAVRATKWKKEACQSFARTPSKDEVFVYVIVPALCEQTTICGAIDEISRQHYPRALMKIIIALDAREWNPRNSTRSAIERHLVANPQLCNLIQIVEHSETTAPRRSSHLNAALDFIRTERLIDATCLIAVYDADSRPDRQTLQMVAQMYQQFGHPFAGQQCVSYLGNIDQMRKSPLALAAAIYQTVWNYVFEVPRLIETAIAIDRGKVPKFPPYCMGHGEFFSLDSLAQIGGFPSSGPCDGIQTGFALTKAGIAIRPIPLDDLCQSPPKIAQVVRQHAFWFSGNLEFFKWYRPGPGEPLSMPVLLHAALNLKWLCRPFAVAMATLGPSLLTKWVRIPAAIAAVAVYYGFATARVAVTLSPQAKRQMLSNVHLVPIGASLKSLGAIRAVYRLTRGQSNDNKVQR